MIHATYVQLAPKGLWYLASVSSSAETIKKDKETLIAEANEKKKQINVAIQTFPTTWFMPETLKEIKEESNQLYN